MGTSKQANTVRVAQGAAAKVSFIYSFSKGLGLVNKDLVVLNTLVTAPSYTATPYRPTTEITLCGFSLYHFLDLLLMFGAQCSRRLSLTTAP